MVVGLLWRYYVCSRLQLGVSVCLQAVRPGPLRNSGDVIKDE